MSSHNFWRFCIISSCSRGHKNNKNWWCHKVLELILQWQKISINRKIFISIDIVQAEKETATTRYRRLDNKSNQLKIFFSSSLELNEFETLNIFQTFSWTYFKQNCKKLWHVLPADCFQDPFLIPVHPQLAYYYSVRWSRFYFIDKATERAEKLYYMCVF